MVLRVLRRGCTIDNDYRYYGLSLSCTVRHWSDEGLMGCGTDYRLDWSDCRLLAYYRDDLDRVYPPAGVSSSRIFAGNRAYTYGVSGRVRLSIGIGITDDFRSGRYRLRIIRNGGTNRNGYAIAADGVRVGVSVSVSTGLRAAVISITRSADTGLITVRVTTVNVSAGVSPQRSIVTYVEIVSLVNMLAM